MMKRIVRLIIICLLLLTACGQGGNSPTQGEGENLEGSNWLFETEAIQTGNELVVTMTVTNQQDHEGSLDFSSGQVYELILTNEQEEEVYRYSDGQMFTMAIIEESFEPNESKIFEETIPLEELSPGLYTLDVLLMVMAIDKEEPADKAAFQKKIEVEIE